MRYWDECCGETLAPVWGTHHTVTPSECSTGGISILSASYLLLHENTIPALHSLKQEHLCASGIQEQHSWLGGSGSRSLRRLQSRYCQEGSAGVGRFASKRLQVACESVLCHLTSPWYCFSVSTALGLEGSRCLYPGIQEGFSEEVAMERGFPREGGHCDSSIG